MVVLHSSPQLKFVLVVLTLLCLVTCACPSSYQLEAWQEAELPSGGSEEMILMWGLFAEVGG